MSISGNKVKFFLLFLLIIEKEVLASPIITVNLSFCFYIAIYIYLFHVFDTVFRRIDAQMGHHQVQIGPQYSRASLVAQLVKNLPAMWETGV